MSKSKNKNIKIRNVSAIAMAKRCKNSVHKSKINKNSFDWSEEYDEYEEYHEHDEYASEF